MRGRRGLALALLVLRPLGAQSPEADFLRAPGTPSAPPVLAAALARMDTREIQRHLDWLADPAREGRGLGTRGLAATEAYLRQELKTLGLLPLGPGYGQAVPLRKVVPGPGWIRLSGAAGTHTFRSGKEAVLPAVAPGRLQGPWVFAGRAIQEPGLGHDDFRGLDVRGKGVVFLGGLPEGPAWQRPDLREKYDPPRPGDRYDTRLALLEHLGARAAVALEPGLSARLAAGQEPRDPFFLPGPGARVPAPPPLARIEATPALLAALSSHPRGRLELATGGQVQPLRGLNLLARLEGSDPQLRQEAVLLGAHMDHLGRPGGVVHPGADDNASGVAALLEIARALAAGPRPKRTLLFAFWTGEEEGKFGSGHYVRHPRWPLARTMAYLNLDMIGHPWTAGDLQTLLQEAKHPDPTGFMAGLDLRRFAEPGLSASRRDLGPLMAEAGRCADMSLHLDWTEGVNGGSDYRDFARRGVPFVRFFGSYFSEYHTPGDTLARLEAAQVRRMANLILATAWLLAER